MHKAWLNIALGGCLALAGCGPADEDGEMQGGSAQTQALLASNPMTPEGQADESRQVVLLVRMRLVSIEVPVGQASGSEEIWSYLDEEPVAADGNGVVGRNGFRVGRARRDAWPDLAETLKDQLEQDVRSKGEQKAQEGARLMERVLAETVTKGRFSLEEIFDENYRRIPETDPPKYHTVYDRYLDETIQELEDEFLKDDQVVFAVLVDRNGYLPTHNRKYSQPLTGDRERDKLANRTKRILQDEVGLAAARNTQGVLVQVYEQDTGEKLWDISAPVYVQGRHWGAFRIGYQI